MSAALDPARWARAWSAVGASAAPALFDEVCARWAEPHRAYHGTSHLLACLAVFDEAVAARAADGDGAHVRAAEVELGLWFHDAIYDPKAKGNEEASAAWAREALLTGGAESACADRVAALVLATKHDAVPDTPDAALLVDVDLSILGADEATFAAYERGVRAEYAWVPDDAFREGRARILRGFLERTTIFATAWFVERFEARARRNLSASLDHLSGRA
ncbi:MAG: hypothetical protein U0414_41280 [Polyangiaceae bacterium]